MLKRRKLVAHCVNRADLREAFLSLTAAGHAIYDEVSPSVLNFARQSLQKVDAEDRPTLDRALKKLTERSAQHAAKLANRADYG